jgi:hypothetical protein
MRIIRSRPSRPSLVRIDSAPYRSFEWGLKVIEAFINDPNFTTWPGRHHSNTWVHEAVANENEPLKRAGLWRRAWSMLV